MKKSNLSDDDLPTFIISVINEVKVIEDELPKEYATEFHIELDEIITEVNIDMTSLNEEKSDDFKFEDLTKEEILEKLTCKCADIKEKYTKIIVEQQVKTLEFRSRTSRSSKSSKSSKSSRSQGSGKSREDDTDFDILDNVPCREFEEIKQYAKIFINDLLEEAKQFLEVYQEGKSDTGSSKDLKPFIVEKPLLIQDFTPKEGKKFILDFICTWSISKDWMFCIELIAENSDTCAEIYIYEVKWSQPTLMFPIPQVTASVFFKIEVSRVKPKHCPVKVSYVFETNSYEFTLEDQIQHEYFLLSIREAKQQVFRSIRM